MAAETGIPSVYLEHQLSHGRPVKKAQLSLIEKLRQRPQQQRSWADSMKAIRNSVVERRTVTDPAETSHVQKCLDTVQRAMKVISQQSLKERLDLIGRQLGLNVQIQDEKISLGMDAFHIDILLDESGSIVDVKLANQGDVVDCPDLKDILKRGDFPEFIEHLQGLQSIYQVTSDENLKSKAFLALQALEKDLNQLAQFQSSISGVATYIHKCPLGIMLPRLAGKPMKLIYFVSPYDLLDKKTLTAHPLTVEAIQDNFLGQSVTVCIEPVEESAPPNNLQTMPLMSVNKTQDGKSLPSFSGVGPMNSMELPASFVLVLPQSIPVSTHILQKITNLTNLEIQKEGDKKTLHSLILETFSSGYIKDSRRLFVSLPDQQHIYFLDGMNGGTEEEYGAMVSRIPFTHPTHVPQILNLMRQQLLFNIVVASCIRNGAKKDISNSIVFEVTAVSLQQLTIVFEHPAYDSMITVDIDLTDITNLKCHVSCSNSDHTMCSDEAVSRAFQRCMSIPVMVRWLISKGRGQLDKLKKAALAAERERMEKAVFLKERQQRQARLQPTTLPTKGRPPPQPPHPPPLPPPPTYSHQHHSHISQGQLNTNGQPGMMPPILTEARRLLTNLEEFHDMADGNRQQHSMDGIGVSMDQDKVHTPLLSNLLDAEKLASTAGGHTDVSDSPMLSRLLDDNTSVATDVIPMDCRPNPTLKRQRKRRSQSDFSGPSPKQRFSDSDSSERLGSLGSSMDLDLSHSPLDQGLGTPISTTPNMMGPMTPTHGPQGHHPMLNHAVNAPQRPQGNVIDLTEDTIVRESSLKKLADSVDKHFPHDVKAEPDLSMLLNENEAGRIPTLVQNSPSGSKNENASTSLEGYLKGSGEVGRAKDFDPGDAASASNSTTLSKLSSLLLAPTDTEAPILDTKRQMNSSFLSDKLMSDDSIVGGGAGKRTVSDALITHVKPAVTPFRKGVLRHSSSVEMIGEKQSITGIFEKFDMPRQQHGVKNEIFDSDAKVVQSSEGKMSLKLRVGPLKQQNNVKSVMKHRNSLDESDLSFTKSNSSGTFDFKSDEDDDEPLMPFPDRYVYTPSPNRLQISSNKQKRLSDSGQPQKTDKQKKKDKSSGNSTKRKKDKDESKREKKRKKTEHIFQESVYRTVENDGKADFKLKIRVAKKPVSIKNDKSDASPDMKEQTYEISKKHSSSPFENKLLLNKQDVKESVPACGETGKEKDVLSSGGSNTLKMPHALGIKSSSHKSSPKSGISRGVQGGSTSSKPDPKLTKATIRLKPVTLPNSGSTVNVSQSGQKATASQSSGVSKTERRSSTSMSTPYPDKRSLLERRGSSTSSDRRTSQSTSSSTSSSSASSVSIPTTTSAANLSLSSILPNAPTVSKIASLPRIPKLSSSSSNTSINRTSSLDPASGIVTSAVGTKSNNSYTMGPAGRGTLGPNAATGQGAGRPQGSNPSAPLSFNNNRFAGPAGAATGGGGPGSNRPNPNFSAGRMVGSVQRQTSPVVNSGQGLASKPVGPMNINRTANPSSSNAPMSGHSQKSVSNLTNSHKVSGGFANNSALKANNGSSNYNYSNAQQKLVGTGAKPNMIVGQKLTNTKSSMSSPSNSTHGQRYSGSSSHSNSSSSIRGSTGSPVITKSPNTQGTNRSPSSGKSPNISGSGKSPSLSGTKSPNITGANRSPNVSSSNVSRSPNINSSPASSSKSPNVTTTSRSLSTPNPVARTSVSSSSSKSSPTGALKQTFNPNKPVNKGSLSLPNTSKSQTPPLKSTPVVPGTGSNKLSSQKSNKPSDISVTTSTSIHPGSNVKSTEVSSPGILKKQAPPSTSPSNRPPASGAVSSPSATSKSFIPQTSNSVTSSQPSEARPSPMEVTSGEAEGSSSRVGQGTTTPVSSQVPPSTSAVTVPERTSLSTSSTPSTPLSADCSKNKFTFPSSRGRKNSLSAIVDKLKNNAAGSSLDLIVPPPLPGDNKSSVSSSHGARSSQDTVANSKELSFMDLQVSAGGEDKKLSDGVTGSKPEDKVPFSISSDSTNWSHSSENATENKQNHVEKCVASEHEQVTLTKSASSGSSTPPLSASSASTGLNSPGSDLKRKGDGTVTGTGLSSGDEKLGESSSITAKVPTKLSPCSNATEKFKLQLSSPNLSTASPTQVSEAPSSPSISSSLVTSHISPSSSLTSNTKINGDNQSPKMPSKGSERIFKVPGLKDTEQVEEGNRTELSDVHIPGVQLSDMVKGEENKPVLVGEKTDTVDKVPGNREKVLSKSLASPLSDISSPENGLVIDDEESPRSSLKMSSKLERNSSSGVLPSLKTSKTTSSSNSSISSSSSSSISTGNNTVAQILGGKSEVSFQAKCETSISSPQASRPAMKSPAVSKNLSGESTPKGSDSPCEIDDDLMDVALGIGS